MGRRPELTSDIRLGWFLLAVRDHPWAPPSAMEALSGLSGQAIQRVAQPLALEYGLVERGDLRGWARAARRFGLTPKGAALLGQTLPRTMLRDAFLRARHLDAARSLLAEWAQSPGLVWSRSPFTLSARHLRPERQGSRRERKTEPGDFGDGAYRSLRFDGLACVPFASHEYRNVAIWVDPGEIALDWFYHQFRSAYAWDCRPEFTWHARTFPLLVVVAANAERRQTLLDVWESARPDGEHPLYFRITSREMLHQPSDKRQWWNQRGWQQAGLWGGVIPFEHPSLPPQCPGGGWWGEPARDLSVFQRWPQPIDPPRKQRSLLRWASRVQSRSARLVRDHRDIHPRGRELLERIGQYPLITVRDLAAVMGRTYKTVAEGIEELMGLGLIHHPCAGERGYVMTSWGLELLAAQAGFSPGEYAKLRHWPIRTEGHVVHYAVDGMLACREHTQLVLDFLVGLRRHGSRVNARLVTWDQVQCLIEFPFRPALAKPSNRKRAKPAHSDIPRVSPDAKGKVRVFGATPAQFVDTPFWLEIDRGTEKGQVLWDKLARYYRIRIVKLKVRSWPRLLIVVERDDETRLRALCRRIIRLNKHYNLRLDVRLTRADLLDDGKARLDPTRKVWRTVESSEFVSAFNVPRSD